jgi:membrane protein implicated in regulation of membrane protease activity
MAKKIAGRAETRKDNTDVEHDRDAMGEVVEVVEDISDDNDLGRIRFQGTTWQARSTTGVFKKGDKAQLVYRDGSLWVVEPVNEAVARDLFGQAEQPVEAPADVVAKR